MVDVSLKSSSNRHAVASGKIHLTAKAYALVKDHHLSRKGSVLGVAQLAGIMAAKQTPNLIPLCHHVTLSHVTVDFELDDNACCVGVRVGVRSVGVTGGGDGGTVWCFRGTVDGVRHDEVSLTPSRHH